MLHFTGLKSLSVFMKPGMNNSGIIPPPNMAMSMFAPHAAPETASSVFPITDISIMMPTKQKAMLNDAIASRAGLRGRMPSQTPSATITADYAQHRDEAGRRLAGDHLSARHRRHLQPQQRALLAFADDRDREARGTGQYAPQHRLGKTDVPRRSQSAGRALGAALGDLSGDVDRFDAGELKVRHAVGWLVVDIGLTLLNLLRLLLLFLSACSSAHDSRKPSSESIICTSSGCITTGMSLLVGNFLAGLPDERPHAGRVLEAGHHQLAARPA